MSSQAPFSPYLQVVAALLLLSLLVTMGLDTEFWNIAIIVGLPWLAAITLAYFATRRRRAGT